MIKKSQPVKTNLKISQEANSPVMKLIKQTGIEDNTLDVTKGIMSVPNNPYSHSPSNGCSQWEND
jgi:hypothetical protein